ncbi:MAG: hypothetical protein H0W72_03540 [Planctomycetes bacterium]|nr:hypothetical protein [Planctomycetota bacterium]
MKSLGLGGSRTRVKSASPAIASAVEAPARRAAAICPPISKSGMATIPIRKATTSASAVPREMSVCPTSTRAISSRDILGLAGSFMAA